MYRRPYFFEVFTIVNFVAAAFVWPVLRPASLIQGSTFLPGFLALAGTGVLARYALLLPRGRARAYLRVIRSRRWLTDTFRICLASALSSYTYTCIKIAVPLVRHQLYDQQLWDFDTLFGFGYSPNLLFLSLFSHPLLLHFVDWTYANVFLACLFLASMYFVSTPNRRLRLAFTNSNVTLWLSGAWLYLLVPSLGPAYRFPEIWQPLGESLGRTQFLQRLLMTNYQTLVQGKPAPVNIGYGVAAFPSLHVAFVALLFLWLRKLTWGRIALGTCTVLIFIGSIVTGWHYLVDSVAGLALAALCYAVFWRGQRFRSIEY